MTSSPPAWIACCLQVPSGSVKAAASPDEAAVIRRGLIEGYGEVLDRTMDAGRCDLVHFPEYILGSAESDLRGVMEFDGPEVAALQAMAQSRRIFLSANGYTRDPLFPGRYFNTSFLIDRSGDIALKYHRILTYHSVSPHDFWSEFIDKVGLEGAFPVARTELGAISMLSSMEMMFPEIARACTLRGAEILLHPTSEKIVDISVKRTRAAENMVFVLSSNVPYVGDAPDMDVASTVIDWEGHVLARCDQGETASCRATIDLTEMRACRARVTGGARPTPINYLSRLRAEVVRDIYAGVSLYPADTYAGEDITAAFSPEARPERLQTSIERMAALGLIAGGRN